MIYIKEYDKFNLDKSSKTALDYYNHLISEVNYDLNELKDYLLGLLDYVNSLKVELQELKDEIQGDKDQTVTVFSNLGYNANATFAQIQGLLDKAEESLNEVSQNIEVTISEIDCGQVTCDYTAGCSESSTVDCNEKIVCTYSEPCSQNPYDNCTFCSYTVTDSEGFGNKDCTVCNYSDCAVDLTCNEATGINPGNIDNCGFEEYTDLDCGETYSHKGDCAEYICSYHGSPGENSDYNDNCKFTCDHHSPCKEASMPEGCTYKCDDYGCNYTGGDAGCDYKSPYCAECYGTNTPDCAWQQDSCTYDTSDTCHYDSSTGFDYDCFEWDCRQCSQGGCNQSSCSEGCSQGDCGQSCSQQVCSGGDGGGSGGPCYEACCDSFDSSCYQSSDSGDSGGGGNVICTYIIKRIFHSDPILLQMSRENVKIAFLNGFSKDVFKEYYYGLGQEIIDKYLTKETDQYLSLLWRDYITPVWSSLREDGKRGTIEYADFIMRLIKKYNISLDKYPAICSYYKNH